VDDLRRAIERLEGLDWLLEWDEEEIAPDADFFDQVRADKPLPGRLYLVMSNQQGMNELLRLWRLYCRNPDAGFPHGLGRLKNVFQQLRDVRRWGVRDRIEETGVLDYWREMVEHETRVLCEAELWFRSAEGDRAKAQTSLEATLAAIGGQCVARSVIPEIAYHGALLNLPSDQVRRILNREDNDLVQLEDVVFFRPSGQMAMPLPPDDTSTETASPRSSSTPSGDAVIALLDGLPVENHPLLRGRVVVDDPDGWASTYPVNNRWHGTGMASLIVHGELDGQDAPQPRPIYVRPILKPNPYDWHQPAEECVPYNVLEVDLLHTAVRRMVAGHGGAVPAAPSVRIVNLSVCDRARPFLGAVSPMARLLDWLSWRYRVLFIVSAGNHAQDILLGIPRNRLSALSSDERQREIILALAADSRNRRLLAPAEGVNVLTVASVHDDLSTIDPRDRRCNPFASPLPSTFNAQGHGFRRSIKPDILMPGGRQLLTEKIVNQTPNAAMETLGSRRPPGHKLACPGAGANTVYSRGTSNSAALASRHGGFLHDVLIRLRSEPNGQLLDDAHLPILLKALLVHGASWGDAIDPLRGVLLNQGNADRFNEFASRFLGYGRLDVSRTLACEPHRATVLGAASLRPEEAHIFRLPLPGGLAGVQAWKRLIITLTWFTPVNPQHRAYRCAHLWFNKPEHSLRVVRQDCHFQATQRGTVQHEIFEGQDADAFSSGDTVVVQVNCREDASGLDEPVPYAIVMTLETAPELQVPIYEQIRAQLQVPVRIAPE
jgi:hypothetical protein